MSRRISWLFVVSLSVAGWVCASPPSVTQNGLACVGRKSNARITAHVEGNPASVRVYFRQAGDPCGDYYVDMRPSPQDASLYSAVLPLVAPDATAITYQVKVFGAGAKEIDAEPMTVLVSDNCAAPPLSPEDLRAAKTIALGLTKATQHAVPCHFKCDGVSSVITASGELKPNDECRLLLAGKLKPWYLTPAALAMAGAGAVGAGVLVLNPSNGPSTPPSPARP
ncbi:MAG TPA: hypothetical protein VF713_25320 [Thermoanaerobaculia bacterium]